MGKKITIKDIAREAGVSAMSVSKALNDKPGLAEDTRARILQTAKMLNYTPNMVARNLRASETKTIGVILSDASEMLTASILHAIQDGAYREGYNVLIASTNHDADRERDAIATLISKQIDGLILVCPILYDDEDIKRLSRFETPFILLMRGNDHMKVDTVISDNYLGGYEIARHLVLEGCKAFQILVTRPAVQYERPTDREDGYFQAFRDYRIPPAQYESTPVKPFIDAGYEATKQLLQAGKQFDGLICGCDPVAIGAMEALLEAGVRIPQEVRLIGYDGLTLTKYLRVPLSTMEQPLYDIGRRGIEILIDRIHYPDMPVRKIVLKSKLVVRASTHLEPNAASKA